MLPFAFAEEDGLAMAGWPIAAPSERITSMSCGSANGYTCGRVHLWQPVKHKPHLNVGVEEPDVCKVCNAVGREHHFPEEAFHACDIRAVNLGCQPAAK